MDEDKNIENKIKESFSGVNKSAPTDLWTKLSDNLPINDGDAKIDFRIKEGFENLNKSAPTQIWNSVNKQLNIDKVWKKLSKELDRKPIIIFWRKTIGVAALLILLLSGSLYLIKNNYSSSSFSQQIQRAQTKKQTVKEQVSHLTTPILSTDNRNKNIASNSISEKSAQTKNIYSELRSEKSNVQLKHSAQKSYSATFDNSASTIFIEKSKVPFFEVLSPAEADSLSFIALMPINANLTYSAIASELIPQPLSLSDNPFKEPSKTKKRFEVGIIYSYNNTWLVNNDTRKSFDENSLIQAIPAWSGSYGIIANYNVFNNNAVSAEFFVNSKYTQRYDEFVEGVFNRRTNEFNYFKLALLYQFNFNQSPFRVVPSKYTFKAGFYGSYLKNHTHEYSRVMSLKTDTYSKADYGARMAIGQEKTFKRIIIGYGLNAEYGFKNIFQGNRQVPSQFNVSRNALIGGYVNLKYSF